MLFQHKLLKNNWTSLLYLLLKLFSPILQNLHEMATVSRSLRRNLTRSFSSTAAPVARNNHQQTHQFSEPNSFIGSWDAPKNPKEAEKKLAQLRRDYAKQVKEMRKGYIEEMELMRLEKQRKDEAKKEALRLANEERKKLKAEAAKVRAEERKVAEEEFRQILVCASSFLIFFFGYLVNFFLMCW